MADEVERIAREAAPDVLWTLAYQGGHPEHDLMHLYAARFHRRLARETGRPLPFFELPAYELGIVPLRFKPWRRAPVHEVRLADAEFARKRAMFDAYPTQWRILRDFERLIRVYGVLSTLRLRPFSFADFGKREEFAPVPPDRDWTRSSHLHPKLDYPGDDYRGTPIRFEKTLAPIARALGLNG
jgi:LmbE family N-acetylglucosaminyl deacetylase